MGHQVRKKKRKKDSPLLKRLLTLEDKVRSGVFLKVGFLDNGERPDGDTDLTMAGLAAVHEYGAPEVKIPERPFVGPSWDANVAKYETVFDNMLTALVTTGKVDFEKVLGVLGLQMATDIRAYVMGGAEVPPTNADSVKKRKQRLAAATGGSVRTLVDKGRLMNAITWVVVNGKADL